MNKLKIGVLYLLLGAGGLWHLLGVFQGAMRVLASPMMFGLGIWLFWEYWRVCPQRKRWRLILWSVIVIVGSIGIEWVGVRTGKIFGAYTYGQTLRPSIDGVPISIGCAWFVMLVASVAVVQKIAPKSVIKSTIKLAMCVAVLMVCFDLFMEPAAGILDYWVWVDNRIPLQNYLAWFGLSFVFTAIGIKLGLFSEPPLPRIAFHFYFAQLIYFGLIDLKGL
ncbi:MAG: carotenoid biosynthesis protein [Candidatus Poribacteria bacterium]|nr:carotenoid biosynthesis protein [Candidatus Poribacteria bacterium]